MLSTDFGTSIVWYMLDMTVYFGERDESCWCVLHWNLMFAIVNLHFSLETNKYKRRRPVSPSAFESPLPSSNTSIMATSLCFSPLLSSLYVAGFYIRSIRLLVLANGGWGGANSYATQKLSSLLAFLFHDWLFFWWGCNRCQFILGEDEFEMTLQGSAWRNSIRKRLVSCQDRDPGKDSRLILEESVCMHR